VGIFAPGSVRWRGASAAFKSSCSKVSAMKAISPGVSFWAPAAARQVETDVATWPAILIASFAVSSRLGIIELAVTCFLEVD